MKKLLRISPLTALLSAVLLAGIALAATPAWRVNGLKFGANDGSTWVTSYGAVGDGVANDRAAIQAAIDAAYASHGSSGKSGVVNLPGGTFIVNTPLVLTGLHNITLRGSGSSLNQVSPSTGPTILVYTGTGASAFIQADGCNSCVFEQFAVTYNNSGFTGTLLDLGHVGSATATSNVVDRMYFGSLGQNYWSATADITLDNDYGTVIKNSTLGYASYGVRFRATNTSASNGNRVEGNWFGDFQVAGTANACQADVITGNVFESNHVAMGAPTMYPAYKDVLSPAPATTQYKVAGFTFTNNWIGDGDESTYVFDGGIVPIFGGVISGNHLGGQVKFFSMNGVQITGNAFNTATNNITFDAGGTYVGVHLGYNTFMAGSTVNNFPANGVNRIGTNLWSSSTGANDFVSLPGGLLSFGASGAAAPTFTTRSAGTKVVLYDQLAGAAADFSLGVESSYEWSGVPTTSQGFKWYAGTTLVMRELAGKLFLPASGNYDVESGSMVLGGTATDLFLNSSGAGGWQLDTAQALKPQTDNAKMLGTTNRRPSILYSGYLSEIEGADVASAGTIAPTGGFFRVSGTAAIATITAPGLCTTTTNSCCIDMAPTGLWTTTTGGNIAKASAAVVGQLMRACYSPTNTKWYPSY